MKPLRTQLNEACEEGNLPLVMNLIEALGEGHHALHVMDEQWTPFQQACANGHLPIVQLAFPTLERLRKQVEGEAFTVYGFPTTENSSCLLVAQHQNTTLPAGTVLLATLLNMESVMKQ